MKRLLRNRSIGRFQLTIIEVGSLVIVDLLLPVLISFLIGTSLVLQIVLICVWSAMLKSNVKRGRSFSFIIIQFLVWWSYLGSWAISSWTITSWAIASWRTESVCPVGLSVLNWRPKWTIIVLVWNVMTWRSKPVSILRRPNGLRKSNIRNIVLILWVNQVFHWGWYFLMWASTVTQNINDFVVNTANRFNSCSVISSLLSHFIDDSLNASSNLIELGCSGITSWTAQCVFSLELVHRRQYWVLL